MNEISVNEAVPVDIGYMKLYCESFKATATAEITGQPTVSGLFQVTNTSRKLTKLMFRGRVYNESNSLLFMMMINEMTFAAEYTIEYKGLQFSNCMIHSLIVEDNCDDFVNVSITVVTPENIRMKD